jgi:hypothetical protein
MRSRIPLFLLLASALTFLASLFLPWRETQAPQASGVQGPLNLFSGSAREIDGWVTGTGDVAVLLVVAVVLATIAALRRPHLAAKLPLRSLAVALTYFAVALAMEIHTYSKVFVAFTAHAAKLHASWAYGFYLGLASAGIALLSGLAYGRSDLLRPRDGADVAARVLGIALLISFLLPWVAIAGPEGYSISGIQSPAIAIAALGLMLGPVGCLVKADDPGVCPLRLERPSSPEGAPAHSRSPVRTGMGHGSESLGRSCSLRSRLCARCPCGCRHGHAGRRLCAWVPRRS